MFLVVAPASGGLLTNHSASEFLAQAAVQGDAHAQLELADQLFTRGDFQNAVVWYRQSAQQGVVEAQLSLAACFAHGRGVATNLTEAAYWASKAEAQLLTNGQSVAPVQLSDSSVPDLDRAAAELDRLEAGLALAAQKKPSARSPSAIILTRTNTPARSPAASTAAGPGRPPSPLSAPPSRSASTWQAKVVSTVFENGRVRRSADLPALLPQLEDPPAVIKPHLELRSMR